MREIQEAALDLFDAQGFAAVTIEDIAAATEVSPSTVYRYFGTKEGLIISDEFDSLSREALAAVFDINDPLGSVRRIVADYESTPATLPPAGSTDTGSTTAASTTGGTGTGAEARAGQSPWRRVRYFFQEPSVRLAVYSSLDQASNRISESLVARGAMPEARARVAAHAFVFGYFAALEQWYREGGVQPIVSYVDEGMWVLRELWATPDSSGRSELG